MGNGHYWWKAGEVWLKVVACVQLYNEVSIIGDCLESLDGKVDEIIVLDGALARDSIFTGCSHSFDGSLEKILWGKFTTPVKLIIPTVPFQTRMDKMNEFFRFLSVGDTAVFVDSDEVVINGLPLGRLDSRKLIWQVQVEIMDLMTLFPNRIFRYDGKMHFDLNHVTLKNGKNETYPDEVVGAYYMCIKCYGKVRRPPWREILKNITNVTQNIGEL